ncbi:MAG: YfhO family protein [Lachnospiraceae bacterium]|nr:YfhO family protein [Lachnospiraceae bacterium]
MNLHLKSILSSKGNDEAGRGFTVSVILITLIIACLPLFTVNCIQGHDIDYHLLRIEALKTGIVNGLPFLRVNMLFFGGEGYASSLFYPDFLLYIPALLRAAGVGINLSYHIFVAFCIIAAFAAMYFSAACISGNRYTALIAAVAYTLCQYHIDDIYTRAAVGEFTACIFLPLVAAGLYDLAEKDFGKPWLLGGGLAGVLLCHTLSTVFCLLLCIVFVIVNYRVFLEKPVKLLKLVVTALFTLALTAFYWLPVMEQMMSAEFSYKEAKFDVNYEKLLLKDIFANEAGRMGIALFLLILTALLIKHSADRLVFFADFLAVTGLLFALCTTGFFPWKRLEKYVLSVQFPWRLFIMTALLLSIAAGIYIERAAGDHIKAAVIAVLALMILSAVSNINRTEEGYYSYSDDYYDVVEYTKSVIGGEWLPAAVESRGKLGKYNDLAFDDSGEKIAVTRQGNSLYVKDVNSEYVDVPFVYYLGYAAEDENGNPCRTDGSGENGRVRVYTGGAGNLHVYYKGTLLQRTADIISIAALILLILLFIRKKKQIPAENQQR